MPNHVSDFTKQSRLFFGMHISFYRIISRQDNVVGTKFCRYFVSFRPMVFCVIDRIASEMPANPQQNVI